MSGETSSRMMTDPDPERVARVTRAFLRMEKRDIGGLEASYRGGASSASRQVASPQSTVGFQSAKRPAGLCFQIQT